MSRIKAGKTIVKRKPKFLEGEDVMAKWPGSTLWYEAVLLSSNYEDDLFLLRFPDGQENEVPYSHLSKKTRFFGARSRSASPSRKKKSSPGGRRRSRSKSPSRKKSPRKVSPGRAKRVSSQQSAVAKDLDEKPPVEQGKVTVTTKTKMSKTPPRTAVGQQLEARVTRSTLKHLEQQGVNTEGIRKGLGEGLDDRKPSNAPVRRAFGGPIGVFFSMLILPLFVLATYLYCNESKCWHLSDIFKNPMMELPSAKEFYDLEAAAVIYGWMAFQVFLSILPLGKVVEGYPLEDGTKLKYRMNGFHSLVISLVSFAACLYFKLPVVALIRTKFLGLMTHAFILSLLLSIFLYIKSFVDNTGFSKSGNTGNPIYDFFMGRQLNPRIGSFDLKMFCELRPGLIGMVIIDLAMLVHVYKTDGDINGALLLICLFQLLYAFDVLWFESSMLSTPDVIKEGFGFMLAFGDLVFVPFIFSLQARFLADRPYKISPVAAALILALNIVGFIVFRVANLQKDLFRQNPTHPAVQHLESMATLVPGSRLLISGWWGYVRHPNYLGDILMGIAWSLTCGFTHAIPYLYAMYITLFLISRAFRLEAHCREKYGHTWDEYCKRVPYRIFPNIF